MVFVAWKRSRSCLLGGQVLLRYPDYRFWRAFADSCLVLWWLRRFSFSLVSLAAAIRLHVLGLFLTQRSILSRC